MNETQRNQLDVLNQKVVNGEELNELQKQLRSELSALQQSTSKMTLNFERLSLDTGLTGTFSMDAELNDLREQHLRWCTQGDSDDHEDAVIAYNNYRRQAALLSDTQEATNIRDLVQEYYETFGPNSKTFYAVGAPSGTGKTQLGFILACYDDFAVVHVTLTTANHYMQPIYVHASIRRPSGLLRSSVRTDYHIMHLQKASDEVHTAQVVYDDNIQLQTVAFLSSIFGIFDSSGSIITKARTFKAALKLRLQDKKTSSFKCPLLVVDEAFQEEPGHLTFQYAALLRSIVGACGVATIFMGTTMDTVTFVNTRITGSSLNVVSARKWCTFIADLPRLKFTREYVHSVGSTAVRSLVETLLDRYPHSNPRFVALLCKNGAAATVTLYEALAATASDVRKHKHAMSSAAGVRAQVLYQLNSQNIHHTSAAILVTAHFAFYRGNRDVYLYGGDVCIKNADGKYPVWQPFPNFPTCAEDPLLALLLGGPCLPGPGTHTTPSFMYKAPSADLVALTSAAAYLLTDSLAQHEMASRNVAVLNPTAAKRDGNLLECLAGLAVINASRGNGIQGISGAAFIAAVAIELQPFAVDLSWANEDVLHTIWSGGRSVVVPFVCRTEASEQHIFPQDVLESLGTDAAVGIFVRTKDDQEIDGKIVKSDGTVAVTTENKNFKNEAASVAEVFAWPRTGEAGSSAGSQTAKRRTEKAAGKSGSGGVEIADVRSILDMCEMHSAASLCIAIVSRVANLRGSVKVRSDFAVAVMRVRDGTIVVEPVMEDVAANVPSAAVTVNGGGGTKPQKLADPVNKSRLLCFLECDEVTMRDRLRENHQLQHGFKLHGP